jgi:Leucine-rich repeat (LRR) protein
MVRLDEHSLLCGESSLVELDVQGNRITEIPPDIGRLSKLKALNVANNDLTDVPYTLGYMNSLQRLVILLCFAALVHALIIIIYPVNEEYN